MTEAAKPVGPSVEVLSVAQVVAEYALPRSTVYELIKGGEWNGFVSKVGKIRVLRDGLEAWIRQGGSRECPITSGATSIHGTGTRGSRRQTASAATGKAQGKHHDEKLKPLVGSGTLLQLRDIPSSRLPGRSRN